MGKDIIACNLFKVVGIVKQTNEKLLKDVLVGDYLRVLMYGDKFMEIELKSMRTNEVLNLLATSVVDTLSHFELEEVVDED